MRALLARGGRPCLPRRPVCSSPKRHIIDLWLENGRGRHRVNLAHQRIWRLGLFPFPPQRSMGAVGGHAAAPRKVPVVSVSVT
jgi:hypothetical protein